jgi:DDE superfamily endonuclease
MNSQNRDAPLLSGQLADRLCRGMHASATDIPTPTFLSSISLGIRFGRDRCAVRVASGTPTDYKRHGTTTLLATLNVPEAVIGRCMQRHRRGEFIRFLKAIERTVPPGKLIETAVDNYATHKHPKMKVRFARHHVGGFQFTPTSGSWLNAVETLFWALTASASDGAAATPSTIANRHQSRSSTSLPN